jgi:hypothetical protein
MATIQSIAIFFGSVSGVDFGKLIVKTPFTMDALMSSFCKGDRQHLCLSSQQSTLCIGEIHLESLWKRQRSRELSVATFTDDIAIFVAL